MPPLLLTQLSELYKTLQATNSHFVRCINPHDAWMPKLHRKPQLGRGICSGVRAGMVYSSELLMPFRNS